METEYVETHEITYGCGCKGTIGRPQSGIFWESLNQWEYCQEHKVK